MKKYSLFALFALMTAASCTVEPVEEFVPAMPVEAVEGGEFIIHAGFAGDTRTAIQQDGKVFWLPGETIGVVGEHEETFTSTNTEPAASADFTGTLPAALSDYYYMYYPVSPDEAFNKNVLFGGQFVAFIPEEQVGKAGSFGYNQDIGVACEHVSALKNVHFTHITGGLRFSVKEAGITKITLKAHGGEPIVGCIGAKMVYAGREYANGDLVYEFPLDTRTEVYYGQYSERYYIQQGGSEVVITPEEGTFVPNANYYIAMRPITMETGFSLYVEKGDDWGTRIDINKRVEIRVSEFRTLQECDKDFDWDNTVLSLSKDQFFLGPYSGGFCTKVVCPGPYTVDPIDADWIYEVTEEHLSRDIGPGFVNLLTDFEFIDDDARFEGRNHVFALKANYGPERSTTVYFRHKDKTYPVKVTQSAGDWLPKIKRTHFGCVFHTLDNHMWGFNTENAFTGYLMNKYEQYNHADGGRLEWVQGAFGDNGFDVFLAGQYLYLQNPAIGGNCQFGMLGGGINLNHYVYDTSNAFYGNQEDYEPPMYSSLFVDAMEWAMDDMDEYYIPTTTIAVKENTCVEEDRTIDVTVEVYAAKAGTYRLTGLLVEQQISYIPGGMIFAEYPANAIVGYVTNHRGEEITFESDNSTKTVTLHAVAPPNFKGYDDWTAGMINGNYGDWDEMWMVFFTAEQFGTQVPFRMMGNSKDYYVDNCLYVKFNTTYDHDGGSHEQSHVDSGIDGSIDFFDGEEQW